MLANLRDKRSNVNKDNLFVLLQHIVPQHTISRIVGWFASTEISFIKDTFITKFAKKYQVNMGEALNEDLSSYASFNDFFTRELKDGARPIAEGEGTLVSPADGAVSQLGKIELGKVFQAKGRDFSVTTLLGGDTERASQFLNGEFATIYLSPKDYHRIHMPMAATLREMIYVPGDLFSVNPLTAQNVPDLFARNERVVTIFDTEHGALAMVLVGATIVASIETVWAGTITPPAGKDIFRWHYPANGVDAIHFQKGDEMGRFKLGSTVVSTFAPNMVNFDENAGEGTVTRLGEHYADIIKK